MALEHVARFDLSAGDVSDQRVGPSGGLIAKARLTRTGVFTYRMPDGSSRRELRHPDDVFAADSLATFPHATVTIDHPGRVTPDNWKSVTVGHVTDAKRDGNFVAGEILLQHGDAIEDAKAGKHRELSMGYGCDIDPTPGTYDGQDFDVRQKNIRINHVGMGPAGWGRMGPDVKLHLDSGAGVSGIVDDRDCYVSAMKTAEQLALEKAEKEAVDAKLALDAATKLVQDAKTTADKLTADAAKSAATIAELTARNGLLELEKARFAEDAKKKSSVAEVNRLVQDTIAVRTVASKVLPEGFKQDGLTLDELDVAQTKRAIIAARLPKYDLGLVQDAGALDAVYTVVAAQVDTVEGARLALDSALNTPKVASVENRDGDPIAKATEEMMKRKKDAYCKTPPRRDRRRDAKGTK